MKPSFPPLLSPSRSNYDAVHAIAVDVTIAIGDLEKAVEDAAPRRAKAVLADPVLVLVVIADDAHGMAADPRVMGVIFLKFIDFIEVGPRPIAQALVVEQQRHHGRSRHAGAGQAVLDVGGILQLREAGDLGVRPARLSRHTSAATPRVVRKIGDTRRL